MEEKLFCVLKAFCPTYLFSVPEDNTDLPVMRFYPLTEHYSYIGDDKQDGKVAYYTVDLFTKTFTPSLYDEVEEALKNMDYLYIESKRTSKEKDVFFVSFDIQIYL